MTGPAATASLPVIRSLLDDARRKDRHSGVIGIRSRPEWHGPTSFTHRDSTVRIVPCASALAVREALLARGEDEWLVVLTDRPDEDLGAGLLAHFLHNRLRTPDPWAAVRDRFAATGIDPALTNRPAHRELAAGLLALAPSGGWPPAPAGVLTLDHALGAVAREHLGLGDAEVDATTVLRWTTSDTLSGLLADVRQLAGDTVVDATVEWAAGKTGSCAAPVLALLRQGKAAEVVPLGLVVGLLQSARESSRADDVQQARDCLIRLEARLGDVVPPPHVLRAWGTEAETVATMLLHEQGQDHAAERVLAHADALLSQLQGAGLAAASDVLPDGLTRRLAALADAMRQACQADTVDVASAVITKHHLDQVERGWLLVSQHALADTDPRVRMFLAAVRLVRWLATDVPEAADFAAYVGRHMEVDSWVDAAVDDAARGVGETELGVGLEAVLRTARARRARHDEDFAAALAAHTSSDDDAPGVLHLEDVLPRLVLPLARVTPTLLLVLDGMSAGVGNDVLDSVAARRAGWAEALWPNATVRTGAVAVLPTLTEVSRASLLSGTLCTGGQDLERKGYAALAAAHGLPGAVLLHKKPLDSKRLGFDVADDVRAALDDVVGRPLVTCILNTIDDALDRSDPAGTDWGADTVRHLEPLLAAARAAGRVVVITADHGHVVERRLGEQRSYPSISSGRSRDASVPAVAGEVLVSGRRVLAAGGAAVLAVDEQVRFGPLKAGYHGGACPAEVVVPVAVLVNGPPPQGTGLRLAPAQEPAWWLAPVTVASTTPAPFVPPPAKPQGPPSLFDELEESAAPVAAEDEAHRTLAAAVLASPAYRDQRRLASRVTLSDEQVRGILERLLGASDARLASRLASSVLGVAPGAVRGAVTQLQQLLNIEGYPVLRVDADGSTLVLDRDLLHDQFEVRR